MIIVKGEARMNWLLYFIVFWLLFIIPAIARRKQRRRIKRSKMRRRKGRKAMSYELIKKFIGKKCYLHGENDFSVPTGVILTVEDNWAEIELDDKKTKLVNLDYITQIEEVPEKKKK